MFYNFNTCFSLQPQPIFSLSLDTWLNLIINYHFLRTASERIFDLGKLYRMWKDMHLPVLTQALQSSPLTNYSGTSLTNYAPFHGAFTVGALSLRPRKGAAPPLTLLRTRG